MVDDSSTEPQKEQPLCIFEGYVKWYCDMYRDKAKEPPTFEVIKNAGPKLMWALRNIQTYRGEDKAIEVIKKYNLAFFGFSLK